MRLPLAWWRHQMETFSASLALCKGNPPVTGGFTSQKPVTRSFDVFFDLYLNERLSKQSRTVIWDTIALIMASLYCFCDSLRSEDKRTRTGNVVGKKTKRAITLIFFYFVCQMYTLHLLHSQKSWNIRLLDWKIATWYDSISVYAHICTVVAIGESDDT